jgi:glycosyltransferase involved in cell wall biosynthesis
VPAETKFDFIFCGRIVQDKNPLFALSVAASTAQRLGRKTAILFVGGGDQEEAVRAEAARIPHLVETEIYGYAASQEELPALYRSARIFLFPTLRDAWGVVANEACAASLPVIVSPHAGVAGELVIDGENGFVRELDAGQWAECAALMLTQDAVYRRFARKSFNLVSRYNFENAAAGIIDACRHALGSRNASGLGANARKVG